MSNRQQRISVNGHSCDWVCVNKGTTQGSVGGPYLFNVFLNDLEVFMNNTPVLFKYADDSTIAAPVWKDSDTSADLVNQFLSWSINNQILCNPSKCKELIFRKTECSGARHQYAHINNIPQCDSLVLLGLTFQPNFKFSEYVRLKLTKANECLHILRTLRKELFSQKEKDHLFKTLVLPILTYGLAVYGASDSDLNVIQRFLDRCHKRHFTPQTVTVFNLLEQQDKSAFKRAIDNHMLGAIIPKDKELVYNLRKRRCHLPQMKTERYKKTFVNRLLFNYNLV